jgi:hypothetical protein
MLIPLKDINHHFELFKVYSLPIHLFYETYASFHVESEYMAVNSMQQSYFTMTTIERKACQGKILQICPADKPIFNMNVNSCLLSLFLQARDINQWCRRSIATGVPTPKLQRHSQTTVYYFAEPTQVTSRCLRDKTWEKTSLVLQVAGTLSDAETCHLSAESVQLYPGLRRETEYTVQAPKLYAPTIPAITSTAEMEQLKKITEMTRAEIEQLASAISAHDDRTDLNTIIRLRPPQTQTPINRNGYSHP